MAGNIFFDDMAPKQLGTWVRYIKSGLEEGEVNKKQFGHVEVHETSKVQRHHFLGVNQI
jgi:hypothetical protein